jgi:hypothetical protein
MKKIWRIIKDIAACLLCFTVVIFAAIMVCFIKVIEVLKTLINDILLK